MLHFFLLILSTLVPAFGHTNDEAKVPTREQALEMIEHNRDVPALANPSLQVARPFAEYETARYLLISDSFAFDSKAAKMGMLKNLPANMVALILSESAQKKVELEQLVGTVLPASRFRVLVIPGGSGFWVRDSLPLPVFAGNVSKLEMALAGAKYFHGNRPGPAVSGHLNVPFHEHGYYYEGGNFLADKKGNCLAIDRRITEIADSVFNQMYGCTRVIRLPFRAGIGHVDERVKFISEDTAVTDEPTYVSSLQNLGYKTYLLPRPKTGHGTYVNALQMNGSVVMPTYNEATDEQAKAIYRGFGFTVTSFSSASLSSVGLGSFHCITMTYPAGTLDKVWNSLSVPDVD